MSDVSSSTQAPTVYVLDPSVPDELLNRLVALSNKIFDLERIEQDTLHSTLQGWRSRLDHPDSIIAYATVNDTREGEPIGFFFSLPKTQPEIGFEALHIWIAGIDHQARGAGLFPRLLAATKAHARRASYDHLSICTIPDRFGNMYRILQKHGWEFVAWREPESERKVLMKLRLVDAQ